MLNTLAFVFRSNHADFWAYCMISCCCIHVFRFGAGNLIWFIKFLEASVVSSSSVSWAAMGRGFVWVGAGGRRGKLGTIVRLQDKINYIRFGLRALVMSNVYGLLLSVCKLVWKFNRTFKRSFLPFYLLCNSCIT